MRVDETGTEPPSRRQIMAERNTFVGLDVHQDSIAVALAARSRARAGGCGRGDARSEAAAEGVSVTTRAPGVDVAVGAGGRGVASAARRLLRHRDRPCGGDRSFSTAVSRSDRPEVRTGKPTTAKAKYGSCGRSAVWNHDDPRAEHHVTRILDTVTDVIWGLEWPREWLSGHQSAIRNSPNRIAQSAHHQSTNSRPIGRS